MGMSILLNYTRLDLEGTGAKWLRAFNTVSKFWNWKQKSNRGSDLRGGALRPSRKFLRLRFCFRFRFDFCLIWISKNGGRAVAWKNFGFELGFYFEFELLKTLTRWSHPYYINRPQTNGPPPSVCKGFHSCRLRTPHWSLSSNGFAKTRP